MSQFKAGDIVCLTFDKKRFLVIGDDQLNDSRISVCYFSESKGAIVTVSISEEYFEIAIPQE